MLQKRAKNSGVSVGEFFLGVADETALSGRGVVGDVRAESTLAARCAVHVEFRDVNGQTERGDFGQRLVHGLKAY